MGWNEGRVWVSLGGVGHVEPSEGFSGLVPLDVWGQELIIWPMNIIGFSAERWCFWGWGMVAFGFCINMVWSMGEIQIMCDIYMDKVGIPILVMMSKE